MSRTFLFRLSEFEVIELGFGLVTLTIFHPELGIIHHRLRSLGFTATAIINDIVLG
jgi:hypothetical protein